MISKLKNQFMQTAFISTIWVLVLLTFTGIEKTVTLNYYWHIIGIGVIFGLIFGVCYPYIWHYGTWSASINVFATTALNFLGGLLVVYLFSVDMFDLILPFWWAMLLLNLGLHIIAFYFYRNQQNKRLAKDLNHLTN